MKNKPIKKSTLFRKLGAFRSVCNLESRNGYGYAPNQFEITFDKGSVFQSYATVIAFWINGQLYLSKYHDCSNTTCLYCKRWTRLTTQERKKGIANGTIKTFE